MSTASASTSTEMLNDVDLPDCPQPRTDEYDEFILRSPLTASLSCTRTSIGTYDFYGVRVLVNEEEEYASVHFQVPSGLPAKVAAQLASVSVQRVPYTDRDRAWDEVGGGCTSSRDRWSAFVDSVLEALEFANRIVQLAVWAHARGERWVLTETPPGRVDDKYHLWGDDHPATYDEQAEYERYFRDYPPLPATVEDDDTVTF